MRRLLGSIVLSSFLALPTWAAPANVVTLDKTNLEKPEIITGETAKTIKEFVEAYKTAHMEEGDEIRAENMVLTVQPQVSLTVQDQNTGYIVAMIGGRGAKIASRTLNRATNTKRQPGSTFKVISTFAPALDAAGMTLADIQVDGPFNYYSGRPVSNWYGSGSYKGICSMRYAI